MTLILTVANDSGVYQSSDYRLTNINTGAPTTDLAGTKQLQASFENFDLRLAFTGVATIRLGSQEHRTIDWLSEELKKLPHSSDMQHVLETLEKRSIAITTPYRLTNVLELVVTVAAVGKPFHVAVISNVNWSKHPVEAEPNFRILVHTITKPFQLISGYRDSVPAPQQHRLEALARDEAKAPSQILKALAEINALAAKNSHGYVSENCWVTSQIADGRVRRSASMNIGQNPGNVSMLFGGFDVTDWVKKNFRAAPGQELGLVQSAGVMAGPGDAIPNPPPRGDSRRFTLSGSSVAASFNSPTGEKLASIEISQLNSVLEMRCNEEVAVPFATIRVDRAGKARTDLAKPLYPWPQISPTLMIDDAPVPRGWEYSIGYWIEDRSDHLKIPTSCRSIRNLAFLGPEDEMVIVAPLKTLEFSWSEAIADPSETLHARIWWRSRLNGTRG
jgi:hypothetical protein